MANDTAKYLFNDTSYNKRQLVLAVIKQYLADTSPNWAELEEAFPLSLSGGVGTLIKDSDLQAKLQKSDDSKRRFFVTDPLNTADGVTFYVTGEWGLGNIGRFIRAARKVGYKVINEAFLRLYEAYKANPRNDWIPRYKKRVEEFHAYKGKLASEYDENLLKAVWLHPNNGISSVKPGFLSQAEYDNIRDELPAITKEIFDEPSPDNLTKVIQWATKAANQTHQLNSVKRGVINRVFAAANPTQYTTITKEDNVNKLISALNQQFAFDISNKGNWADKNIALTTSLKNEGLKDDDVYLVNTFAWHLFEKLVQEGGGDLEVPQVEEEETSDNFVETHSSQTLNKILYGPPGTGKTYHTVDNAILIIDPEYYQENSSNRAALKNRFDQLVADKRIGFVTFHQSFSYEDFVEGIRAETDEEGSINYSVHDGIFKELCDRAKSGDNEGIDEVMEKFIVDIEDNELQLNTSTGKGFSVSYRGGKTFRIKPDSSDKNQAYRASIENIKKMFRGVNDKSIYNSSYVKSILEYLVLTYGLKEQQVLHDNQPVVLIIDEINRGNTANIFGELITLIEPSKRAGSDEALEVTLPYSKERFSVPDNLYIIGTMNTADRSLALLDTALRRRFKFEEMEPQPELLSDVNISGINIQKLLETINKRISLLYDREHRIGHSFFMSLKQSNSFDKLKEIFANDILPLLEEYFFEDWQKISQVLGDSAKKDELKIIIPSISEAEILELLGDESDDLRNMQYQRNHAALNNPQAYKAIYEMV